MMSQPLTNFSTIRASALLDVDASSRTNVVEDLMPEDCRASGYVDHVLGAVTDVNFYAVRERQRQLAQAARDLADTEHAIRSVTVSILLKPNTTPVERATALGHLRGSVTPSLTRLLLARSGASGSGEAAPLRPPSPRCAGGRSDWFEDTPLFVRRRFGLLVSQSYAALGLPPLVYEILRWNAVWEGTDEIGRVVSSGLESILFFIDVWEEDEENDGSESSGLIGVVANACLQLEDHSSADPLFQKLLPFLRSAYASKKLNGDSSLWPTPLTLADYFISTSISPSSQRRNAKGKAKASPLISHLPGCDNKTAFDEQDASCTSLIGLQRFAAALRDAKIDFPDYDPFPSTPPNSSLAKRTSGSSPLSAVLPSHNRDRAKLESSTSATPIRSRRNGSRLFSPYSPHALLSTSSVSPPSPAARVGRMMVFEFPELTVPFLALRRAWLLRISATTVSLSMLENPGDVPSRSNDVNAEVSASVRIIPSFSSGATQVVELPPINMHPSGNKAVRYRTLRGSLPQGVLTDSEAQSGSAFGSPSSSTSACSVSRFDDPRLLDEDGTLMLELELLVNGTSSSLQPEQSLPADLTTQSIKPTTTSSVPPPSTASSSFQLLGNDLDLDSELDAPSSFSLLNSGSIPPTGTSASLSLASRFEILSWADSDAYERLSAAETRE